MSFLVSLFRQLTFQNALKYSAQPAVLGQGARGPFGRVPADLNLFSFAFTEKAEAYWLGGKLSGNIQLNRQTYYIRLKSKTIAKVKIEVHGTPIKAYTYAKKMLYDHCRNNFLLKNSYKFSQDNRGPYLQVRAGTVVFMCDIDRIELIEKFVWKFNKNDGVVFTSHFNEKVNAIEVLYFHRMLFDLDIRYKVEHIDGDKLNNRRYNLLCKKTQFLIKP